MKKVLGIIAIVGLGALLYYQYKKMTKKSTDGKTDVINRPDYAKAREKTKTDLRAKTKTALKGKFAELKQQNQ
jgi:hypothetical protein